MLIYLSATAIFIIGFGLGLVLGAIIYRIVTAPSKPAPSLAGVTRTRPKKFKPVAIPPPPPPKSLHNPHK
jgi:hypothetical protein